MSGLDGGFILVLSFALLAVRRAGTGLVLAAGQAVVLAGAAALRGRYPEAAAILLLNGVALPGLLRSLRFAKPNRPRIGAAASLCAGAVLTLLAVPFGVKLAVLLLGILVAAASRDRVVQVLGLLAMQSGIALAGLDLPPPERLAAILPLIPALACAALWASRRQRA